MNNSLIIPLCPHCNSNSGVVANVRAFGWCVEYTYNEADGIETQIDTDHLNFTRSNTFRCPDCKKVRRDIKRDGYGIAPNIKQHGQSEICPECCGDGVGAFYETAPNLPCETCKGTGKLHP